MQLKTLPINPTPSIVPSNSQMLPAACKNFCPSANFWDAINLLFADITGLCDMSDLCNATILSWSSRFRIVALRRLNRRATRIMAVCRGRSTPPCFNFGKPLRTSHDRLVFSSSSRSHLISGPGNTKCGLELAAIWKDDRESFLGLFGIGPVVVVHKTYMAPR